MNRIGLALITGAMVVTVVTGCGSSSPVPRWKDAVSPPSVTEPADPAVTGSAPPPIAAPPDAEPITPQASADQTATAAEKSGARFLEAVRGELPEATMDLRNEEITEMGGHACASLAAGNPRRAVAEELGGFGLEHSDAKELITLARSMLCTFSR